MYKSTPSAAWCKKRLLVTSLFAAIYQTSAIAADTSAVSGEAVDDTSEQMTVTAPAPVQKACRCAQNASTGICGFYS